MNDAQVSETIGGAAKCGGVRPVINWGDPRLPESFWDKVSPCPMSGCWLWVGSYTGDGRSRLFRFSPRRVAFDALIGNGARGDKAISSCGNLACCHPLHTKLTDPGSYYSRVAKERKRKSNLKESIRKHHLKKRYGLSIEEFSLMFQKQDGRCAICRSEMDTEKRTSSNGVHVDHDHDSGTTRELLCSRCNRGLGQFLDSPSLLRAAALYLEKHGKS